MRYAYGITAALLLGGTAATVALQPNVTSAQTAQNEPGAIAAAAPRAGAPMSFADMVARLQPAVVNISTTQRVQVQSNPFAGTPFERFFGQQGGGRPTTREGQSLGSGFIVSADGYVVTNNHVIAPANNATVESVTVTLSDRREFTARVVGRDPASDLAVLKIEGERFPFVRFGDSNQARVGDWVVAIGNPFGLGGSVTAGIISSVNRVTGQLGAYDRFIQTDASINRGNSGGPLFDMQGNVIGINSQILSPTGGNVGIGLAIPAEQAQPIVETLKKGQTPQRGYLGVGIQPIDEGIAQSLGIERNQGELINRVEPGQAAERAGIRRGDVVLRVNNQAVTPDTTLSYLVANVRPGTRIPIEVLRDGRRVTLTATVGTRPSEEELAGFSMDEESESQSPAMPQGDASLGVAVQALTPTIARSIGVDPSTRGVVITAVDPSSDAYAKGLRRGVVIQSVNRTEVATPADLERLVNEARRANRGQVLLYVMLRNVGRFVAVELGE
ncbi:Do family serine endopeptidase [Sphingomonas baiyangensis]|uniref:Probable periplasmic serine endoprotease DegP-like n=1 Tax=Sphingomonas baiyangensis TaxID=2572576 RepID=A0A4U1L688_9SPHN|nr:Do family serine endopeptidase [Sphingomonas baiyangensis]TKD51736.1 Do family serine endopeptidase [Sphingomonas baiyangensis]